MSESTQAIAEQLRWQADACRMIGSELYAGVLERAVEDVEAAGPSWEVLRGHEDDPRFTVLGLRLLGAANRLALTGREPALAEAYAAGRVPEAWEALRDVLRRNAGELRDSLERPVQTNEVGRCGCSRSAPAPGSTCAGTVTATRPPASPGARATRR